MPEVVRADLHAALDRKNKERAEANLRVALGCETEQLDPKTDQLSGARPIRVPPSAAAGHPPPSCREAMTGFAVQPSTG